MSTYVIMGNAGYYGLMSLNVSCIRRAAPWARILVYDWGDARGRPSFSCDADGVDVVDWTGRISDIRALERSIGFEQKVRLAIAYNSRFPRTFFRRLRKAILKYLPATPLARPPLRDGLVFENMLLQKVPCMRDASGRVGNDRMIFLDADAFLRHSVEDAYDLADFDAAVTLATHFDWGENRCNVINSGVILFGARPARRDALLDAWQGAIDRCNEWLREQTALVRLLAPLAPDLFVPGGQAEVVLGGEPIHLLALPCAGYNNTNRDEALAMDARVLHLANSAQNLGRVAELLDVIAEG